MVLVRPELSGVKEVSIRKVVRASDGISLLFGDIRTEIGGRQERQNLHLILGHSILLIAIQDIFLAHLRVGKEERRIAGSVSKHILAAFALPTCRDLRELGLETVVKIMYRHHIRKHSLERHKQRR